MSVSFAFVLLLVVLLIAALIEDIYKHFWKRRNK